MLSQGATNSMAHMMNAMNKELKDFIPEKNMPFLDDLPIKGYIEEEKDESLDSKWYQNFVAQYINHCNRIFSKLEEVHLILFRIKLIFGVNEILLVEHMCGPYGQKPSMEKVDAIQRMKE